MQAQLSSAAELAIWARVAGVQQGDVDEYLWNERTLVKTWAMRGTLHLLPSSQLSTYTSVLARTRTDYSRSVLAKEYGVAQYEIDRAFALIGNAVAKGSLTRQELADVVSRDIGAHLKKGILSGWGEFLKPVAFNGKLIAGPPKDGRTTFVGPDRWLETHLRREDFDESLRTILRNYLAAYGPATHQEFGPWWSFLLRSTRKLFMSISDEISTVDVEGYQAWVLTQDLEKIQGISPVESVRLLPSFDVFLLHFRPRNLIVPEKHMPLVFRPQGWISPVILVDSRVVGTWELLFCSSKRRHTRLFKRLTQTQKNNLQAGVEGLGTFLDRKIVLDMRQA